jgi:hypothetical protein
MTETAPPFDPEKFTGAPRTVTLGPFDMARLARDTVATVSTNWVLVGGLSFCLVALPKLAVVATHLSFHGRLSDEDSAYDTLNAIDTGLDYTTFIILQLVLTWALGKRRDGEALTLSSLVSLFFPLIFVSILTGIGMLLGLLVFVIPGLMLFVRWSVAANVVVSEGKSPFAAMGRSAALVNGYGWPIFGALLLCSVFQWLWDVGVTFVGEAMLGIWPDNHINWIIEGLAAPWGTLPSVVTTIALYFHLVALKEGGTEKGIADVFD